MRDAYSRNPITECVPLNCVDTPEHMLKLIGKIMAVNLETIRIVKGLLGLELERIGREL